MARKHGEGQGREVGRGTRGVRGLQGRREAVGTRCVRRTTTPTWAMVYTPEFTDVEKALATSLAFKAQYKEKERGGSG